MNSLTTTFNRYIDINEVINYIAENGLDMTEFKVKGDYISIVVHGEHVLDIGMFEEFLDDMEQEFDRKFIEA